MTPEYASPEQLEDRPVTTASDVYSLGVVLFSLLTGSWPYIADSATPDDIARAVRIQTPRKPSTVVGKSRIVTGILAQDVVGHTLSSAESFSDSLPHLRKQLTGDLDAITLKSLERDLSRRYSSVEQFADDTRRFLNGLPVQAHLPTLRYRAAKFIRRNLVAASAGALVAICALIAVGWIVRAERAANQQRARAEARFNDVRKLSNALIFEVDQAVEGLPGAVDARKKIVSLGLQYLDGLQNDAVADVSLRREIAEGYRQIGSIQGEQGSDNLGDTAGAIASYEKAVKIQEGIVNSSSANERDRSRLSQLYLFLSHSLHSAGKYQVSLDYDRKALGLLKPIPEGQPMFLTNENRRGVVYDYMAQAEDALGDSASALKSYATALASYQQVAASKKGYSVGQYNIAQVSLEMSAAFAHLGEYGRARELAEKSVQIQQAFYKNRPHDVRTQSDLADGYNGLGSVEEQDHKLVEAMISYREAERLAGIAFANDHNDQQAREALATAYLGLSQVQRQQTKIQDALKYAQQALQLSLPMASADSVNADDQDQLAHIYASLGDIYAAQTLTRAPSQQFRSGIERAISFYQKADEIYGELRSRGALRFSSTSDSKQVGQEISRYNLIMAGTKSPS